MDALSEISTRRTPQSEKAEDRQVENNAGGYVFAVSEETRIHRFLTLGTDGGTYYVKEKALTKDNADVVIRCARQRGSWLVQQAVSISVAGRAPKQNPAIFALAAVAGLGNEDARRAAFAALPQVCRTASTLTTFIGYMEQFRGWGRAATRAVGSWYANQSLDDLAYQAMKYRARNGWSQRDILRSAHPGKHTAISKGHDDLFGYLVGKKPIEGTPLRFQAYMKAQNATTVSEWVSLVQEYKLPWETLPDAALAHKEVWKALVVGMPVGALIRQLPKITRSGAFDDLETLTEAVFQLQNGERLRRSRVHPVAVLMAARTYASGRSVKGDSTWTPKRAIIDALDDAFYAAFEGVEPSGKKLLVALDVSGSMDDPIPGQIITAREFVGAMALVFMRTEPLCDVIGFTGGARGGTYRSYYDDRQNVNKVDELTLSPKQRLDDALTYMRSLRMGATDCALPMLWAQYHERDYDTILVATDNETWCGEIHPQQALRSYRSRVGHPVRQIILSTTPTQFSIANPDDKYTLDIPGVDARVPTLVTDFSRGDI